MCVRAVAAHTSPAAPFASGCLPCSGMNVQIYQGVVQGAGCEGDLLEVGVEADVRFCVFYVQSACVLLLRF